MSRQRAPRKAAISSLINFGRVANVYDLVTHPPGNGDYYRFVDAGRGNNIVDEHTYEDCV